MEGIAGHSPPASAVFLLRGGNFVRTLMILPLEYAPLRRKALGR